MADEEVTSTAESTVEPSGASQETTTETPAGEVEFDITKIPADKLATHPEFQRQLQSLKDKEAARIERQYRERQRTLAEQRRREVEDSEFDTLLESEDYDSIGRKTAESRREQQRLTDATKMVSGVIESVLRERPEFKVLGEDTIESIYEEVQNSKGNVVDFMVALSNETGSRRIKKETETIRKSLLEEMDARLAEHGLIQRSEAADRGEAPSGTVSRASGATGMTPDKYLNLSTAEFDALPDEVHQRMTAELAKRR